MIPSPDHQQPLLPWLLETLGANMPRSRVRQLLQFGRIAVNGSSVTRHDHPVGPADRLSIVGRDAAVRAGAGTHGCGIPVVYMDDHLIVVDKPAGLLSVATDNNKTDTAFTRLKDWLTRTRSGRPYVVHRLDRDTSGLLVFARSPAAHDRLQHDWEDVSKTYMAICEGSPDPAAGTIDTFLEEGADLRVRVRPTAGGHAKRAVTLYRVTSSQGGLSLVEVQLQTGRKHQIRVHLASLGCPIVGDRVYGNGEGRRMALHAWRLEFKHPISSDTTTVISPWPDLFQRWAKP